MGSGEGRGEGLMGGLFLNERILIRASWEIATLWTWASGHLAGVDTECFSSPRLESWCACSAGTPIYGVGMRNQNGAVVTTQTYLLLRMENLGASWGIPWEMLGAKRTLLCTQMLLPVSLSTLMWPPTPLPECSTFPHSGPWFQMRRQSTTFAVYNQTWIQKVSLPPGHLFCIFNFNFSL